MHSAPKRQARYTPMPLPHPGLSFLCSELTRTVKTLRFAPARSLIYFATAHPAFCLTLSLNLLSSPVPLPPPPVRRYTLFFFLILSCRMSLYKFLKVCLFD